MTKQSVEIAVGLFVVLGILCVGYLTVKLGKMEENPFDRVQKELEDFAIGIKGSMEESVQNIMNVDNAFKDLDKTIEKLGRTADTAFDPIKELGKFGAENFIPGAKGRAGPIRTEDTTAKQIAGQPQQVYSAYIEQALGEFLSLRFIRCLRCGYPWYRIAVDPVAPLRKRGTGAGFTDVRRAVCFC